MCVFFRNPVILIEEYDLIIIPALKNSIDKLHQAALLVVCYYLLLLTSEGSKNILIELLPMSLNLGKLIVLDGVIGSGSHGLCKPYACLNRHSVTVLPVGNLDNLTVDIPIIDNR